MPCCLQVQSLNPDSLWPHRLQFPSFSVLHYLSEFAQTHVHSTISPSVAPFSFCPQSFLASESFPMSRLFTSGGQVLELQHQSFHIQGWSPLGWTGFISLQSKVLSRVFSKTTLQKRQSFVTQPSLWSNSHIHDYLKNHSFDYMELCWQSNVSVMTITVSSIGSGNVNALYITQYIAHSGYTVNTGWLKKNN